MLLANRLMIPLRMPQKNDGLQVGYYSGENYAEWHPLGETYAWNYHKGCRLQWCGDDNHMIYNICEDDTLKAAICDINSDFSYGRLEILMPGYGYVVGDNETFAEAYAPEETGLYLIDLQANTRCMLMSLRQLATLQPEEDMTDKYHFITHTEFSPDGRYVAFLHRWYKGTFQRTRLVVYDLQTDHIDSHVFFSDPTMCEWKRCGYPLLNSDGHHHFIDDENFVVDTYPDKYRHMKLWQVNVNTDEVKLLADVKSLKRFVNPDDNHNWKCDLHPRVSVDGSLVSFDSTHTGQRSLCVMRIQ